MSRNSIFYAAVILLFAGVSSASIQILPEAYLRGYDPVTVIFQKPVGPDGGGPLDRPAGLLKVTPEIKGEFRFVDAKTVQFRPADPWPPLSRYRWEVSGETKFLYTMMAPPKRLIPDPGVTGLKEFHEVTLHFADPIDVATLGTMISFEIRPLPGIEKAGGYWLTDKEFQVKELQRGSSQEPARYIVTLDHSVDAGYAITLHIRLSLEDESLGSFVHYTFSTREDFRITSVGAGGISFPIPRGGASYTKEQAINLYGGNRKIRIDFNAELAGIDMSVISELVSFDPAVRNLSFRQDGRRIVLSATVEDEVIYKVSLRPTSLIKDRSDRLLRTEGNSEFHFYAPKPMPFIAWNQSRGILERYGPQELPVRSRGFDKIDIRIYKIDPLDRRFWPFGSNPVVIDENRRPPGPGEEPPSPEQQRGRRPSADILGKRIQLLGAPLVSRIVELPFYGQDRARRYGIPVLDYFEEISGPQQPGTYLVGYRRLNEESTRSYVRVQVTDLCLSNVERSEDILFVVTSLRSGNPISGVAVVIEGKDSDGKYVKLREGETDDDGQFTVKRKYNRDCPGVVRTYVKQGSDFLVIDPTDPPPTFAQNYWYGPKGRWLGKLCDDKSDIIAPESRIAHVITERPMYRPGERVHIKGYVRARRYRDITSTFRHGYTLNVTAPSGREWKYPLSLTEDGTFYQEFQADDMPTGEYLAYLMWRPGEDHEGRPNSTWRGGSTTFRVENYRVPTFEVRLHGPDVVPMDDPFTVTLTASYYAGGRVTDQQVNWRATQFPYVYVPKTVPGFIWSSTRRYTRAEDFTSEPVVQKVDQTDQQGASALILDPTLEIDGGPRRYVVEGTVLGADEQTVTATKSIVALPAFSLGLQVDRYIEGEKIIRPKFLALGIDEKPLAGKEITLRVFSREWHSHLEEADLYEGRAKYVTDEVDTEIWTTTLTSSDGPDSVEIPVERAGVYIVKLEARDKLGRVQVVSADLYLAGEGELAWEKPRGMVFDCVTDKERYDPGDTARILLKSPFQKARVLAVIEHPEQNEYHWVTVRGGKAEFDVTVHKEHVPKLPVHFLLMRGRGQWKDDGERRHDLTKPMSLGSTIWLPVTPRDHLVMVTLDHPPRAMPRDTVDIQIALADPDGNPLSGEVTLWLVDQAVLALGEEKPLDPLPTFLPKARSNVRIADTRNRAVGLVPVVDEPGGGGSEREMAPELLDKVTVRKKIVPVPYYNPRILVSDDGTAKVSIELPDNVTNFKIRAVVCSDSSRFGIAKSTLAVRLPMVVQSALPRFVRPGDSFQAGGIGRVVEGTGGPGWCKIAVDGLSVGGDTTRRINWVPGRAEKLLFPLRVDAPDWDEVETKYVEVTLSILRDVDGVGDALHVELPIRHDRKRVRFEKLTRVAMGNEVSFPEFKEAPREGTVEQKIVITSEAAVLRTAAALDYLLRYPYGCTEQVVSQALPLVAMRHLLEPLGMTAAIPAVTTRFNDAVQYIARTQNTSGLYSYWPNSSSYVYLTAYVVEFLVEAKQAGFEFPERLLTRSIAALQRALRSDYSNFVSGWRYVERADALYALSRAGHFEESYGIELMRKNQYMDAYGRARVALALVLADREGLAANLEQPLWDEVVFRLRDSREVFSGLQEQKRGYSWGGVINSSEIRSTAWLLRALARLKPTDQKIGLMTRGLVDMGDQYGWGNTWNNASCMITLAELLERGIDRPEDLVFKATFEDEQHRIVLSRREIAVSDFSRAEVDGAILLEGGEPDSAVVARMTLSYVPQASGDSVASAVNGLVVSRELALVSSGDEPTTRQWLDDPGQVLEYRIGDIIEEHVRVVNPEKHHFVAVIVPFAAGFEPLNPDLAISGPEATPCKLNTIEPSYKMFEDDQAGFYFETMPKGTHDFYFRLRATFEGSFVHPAAWAEMMYQETTRGNSPGARVKIVQREE